MKRTNAATVSACRRGERRCGSRDPHDSRGRRLPGAARLRRAAARHPCAAVDEVVLHDVDAGSGSRPSAWVLDADGRRHDDAPTRATTTDLDDALRGADFVFSAIRVGGLEGRTADERVALDLGRARPGDDRAGRHRVRPAHRAGGASTSPSGSPPLAPDAWVINFTNPAGMVTEAMQGVLGDRVIGICDTPIGLARRASRRARPRPRPHDDRLRRASTTSAGCAALTHQGRDVLPDLLADEQLLAGSRRAGSSAPSGSRTLGAIPNEYLYYYYFTRDAVASIRGAADPRRVPAASSSAPSTRRPPGRRRAAAEQWDRVRARAQRHVHGESRDEDEERDEADVEGGGYEGVALAIMAAITRGERLDHDPQRPQRLGGAGPARGRRRRGAVHRRRHGPHPLARAPPGAATSSAWSSRSRRSSGSTSRRRRPAPRGWPSRRSRCTRSSTRSRPPRSCSRATGRESRAWTRSSGLPEARRAQ